MRLFKRQDLKKTLIIVHDLVATALAVVVTFFVRFEGALLDERLVHLPGLLPPFLLAAGLVYWFFHLYRSRWRFASLPDLFNIFRAASVLALVLLVADYVLVSPQAFGFYFFGKIAIALYWLVQMFLLGGPRLAFRYLKYARSRHTLQRDASTPTLLLGRASDMDVILRAVETGAVKKLQPRGILSYRNDDLGQAIRGVPVLGTFADLEQVVQDFQERGSNIRRLVAAPSALQPEAQPDRLIAQARRLGLPLSRVTSLGEGMRGAEIAPLEIEDLLLRPTVEIDRGRLERFMRGKRVLVTGGGGSIGSEICARAVAFGASDLLVVESSEPSLHHVLETPALAESETRVDGVIADVRDRPRMLEVMQAFRPDVVFHAAALKHVPYLEANWTEGVKTNVFGSVNVADAAVAAGVSTLVMISTDKAIDPVSMLGVTKRLAEMYAQALDAEMSGTGAPTRLIAVRFGNVLGSVGSVVPKFKAQIARGGPITVTHPDMVRYFMTIREAADLVLTSASHAGGESGQGAPDGRDERASVYVLKMGQPVRIYDLAERMIRLAGFEPGEDIEIQVTGTRPGERLHEILFAREEPMLQIGIDGVMAARPVFADRARLEGWLAALSRAVAAGNRAGAEAVFEEAVPEFRRRAEAQAATRPSPAPAAPEPLALPRRAASQGA
ncbi:MAG TPA: nucleoside-diphosphate sugar epimerase/dehydratase [Microvirga sp.]|jgi:O-antigen biosynthesis protein WbqV|nr:nucleoside-diphosphate sugar epimerase/dehydratase [Microvirga sp.]